MTNTFQNTIGQIANETASSGAKSFVSLIDKIDNNETFTKLPKSAINRRADLAFLANILDIEGMPSYQKFKEERKQYKTKIELGREKEIKETRKLKDMKLTASSLAGGNFPIEIAAQLMQSAQGAPDKDILERSASEALAVMSAEDSEWNDLDFFLEQSEDLNGAIGVKAEILRRQLYIKKGVEENLGLTPTEQFTKVLFSTKGLPGVDPYLAASFAASMVPFRESTASTGNVKSDKVTKRFYDWIFSGERVKSERNALFDLELSPEEFNKLADDTVQNIIKSSTDLGIRDSRQAQRIANQLITPMSAFEINAWNALDNVGTLGAVGTVSTKSVVSLLRTTGNRRNAERLLAAIIDDARSNGLRDVSENVGLTFDNIADEALPTGVNPAADGTVSISINSMEQLETGQRLTDEIVGILQPIAGEIPEEAVEAAQEVVARAREFMGGRKPIDVDYENVSWSGSGLETGNVVITVGKADGKLFTTYNGASRYAKSMGWLPEDTIKETIEINSKGTKISKNLDLDGLDNELAITLNYLDELEDGSEAFLRELENLETLTKARERLIRRKARRDSAEVKATATNNANSKALDEVVVKKPKDDPLVKLANMLAPFRAKKGQEFVEEGVDYIINPTSDDIQAFLKGDADSLNEPLKVLATPNGNAIVFKTRSGTIDHTTFAGKFLGGALVGGKTAGGPREIKKLGRGFYDPDKVGVKGYFDPDNPLDSLQYFEDWKEGPWKLKGQTEATGLSAREVLEKEIQRELNEADVLRARLGIGAINDGRAPNYNFLREAYGRVQNSIREKRAQLRALGHGSDVDVEIFDDPYTKTYGIRVRLPLDMQGFYQPFSESRVNTSLGRHLLGNGQLLPKELFGLAGLGEGRRNRILSAIKKNLIPRFKKLNSKERRQLNEIVEIGERESVWFTRSEIEDFYFRQNPRKSQMPDRVYEAYTALIDINNIEYFYRNMARHNELNRRGWQTIAIQDETNNIPPQNGRQIDITSNPDGRVFNVTDDIHYVGDRADEFDAVRLRDEGYVMMRTESPVQLRNGVTVQNFVIKKGQYTLTDLNPVQIPYRPGGHRIYADTVQWFVKQGRRGRQPDTRQGFVLPPYTWKGGKYRDDLVEWTDTMNRGLIAARRHAAGEITETGLKRILGRLFNEPGYPDPQDFINNINDNVFSLTDDFEIVGNRELPSLYNRRTDFGLDGDFVIDQADMPGNISYVKTRGSLYYSKKGDSALTDIFNEELPTLDAFEAVNRSIVNVANLIGFTPFKQRAIERWTATYSPHFITGRGTDPSTLFREMPFRESVDPRVVKAAKQQRDAIMRVMRWETKEDRALHNFTRDLVNFVDGGRGTLGRQAAKLINWTSETNIINKLRGAAFDLKLGLGNIGQLPFQMSTTLAAASIDVTAGANAFRVLPLMRVYATGARPSRESVEAFLNGNRKTFGFVDSDDFMDMMDSMVDSGWLDINNMLPIANDFTPSNAFNVTGNFLSDVKEMARFFFYEAERFNRIVGWNMAWQRITKKYPSVDRRSQEFLELVREESSKLTIRMDEAASARWQQGAASVPTKFFAYPTRMSEAIFGKDFTQIERLRLALGQFAYYGSSGLLITAAVNEFMSKKHGTVSDIGTWESFLQRGLIDNLIYFYTDNDISYAERAAVGNFYIDLVREAVNMGRYGDTSALELTGGATFSITLDLFKDILDLVKVGAVETGAKGTPSELTTEAFIRVLRNASSINNTMKAYAAFKFGHNTSADNKLLGLYGDKSDAIALALGLPLGEQLELNAQMGWLTNRSENVKNYAREYHSIYLRYLHSYDDENARERVLEEMKAFYNLMIPETLRPDVMSEFRRMSLNPIYESIGESIRRKQNEEEALERVLKVQEEVQ